MRRMCSSTDLDIRGESQRRSELLTRYCCHLVLGLRGVFVLSGDHNTPINTFDQYN